MNEPEIEGIIFVYNADSGLFNTLTDIAHKIFSPETYSCNLCGITYGNFKIREEWKTYLDSLSIGCEFLHRDEAITAMGLKEDLPVILARHGEEYSVLLSASEINQCETIGDLTKRIDAELA